MRAGNGPVGPLPPQAHTRGLVNPPQGAALLPSRPGGTAWLPRYTPSLAGLLLGQCQITKLQGTAHKLQGIHLENK